MFVRVIRAIGVFLFVAFSLFLVIAFVTALSTPEKNTFPLQLVLYFLFFSLQLFH